MKGYFLICCIAFSAQVYSQTSFIQSNFLLEEPNIYTSVPTAVYDMNQDGLDDIIRLQNGVRILIDYQQTDGTFTRKFFETLDGDPKYALTIADLDNNGFPDLMIGGQMIKVKVFFANADGSAFEEYTMPGDAMFAQGSNFVDINKDQFLDAFACHDVAESRIWKNNQNKTFATADDWIDMSTVPISTNEGNYGSVWSDFDLDGDLDLYIAKCKQGSTDPTDPRRINQLFKNDGNGNFSEVAAEHGLKIGAQSWTVDFGDIDNDGDFDCFITNHLSESQIFENDGQNNFIDITPTDGSFLLNFAYQAKMVDLDNDGFLDLLVVGNTNYYFHNNGDKTFSLVSNVFENEPIFTFAIGDLNHDGFPDVSAGYGKAPNQITTKEDKLWLNVGNDNNWIVFELEGFKSNRDAIGALIKIKGDWGTQLREVRAGESYGTSYSQRMMFGLGQATNIDEMVVEWPSGAVTTFSDLAVNQHLKIKEEDCFPNELAIELSGPTSFCSGDSLQLTAPAGYDEYLWSNGAQSQSIIVKTTGFYSVQIISENCIACSDPIEVKLDPDETPTILEGTALTICPGELVTLTSSEASNYDWSNGSMEQSIQVTDPNTYTVMVNGLCDTFHSTPFSLTHYNTELQTQGDTVLENEFAVLTSNGINPKWYDEPTGGSLLHVGNEYATPVLQSTRDYFVEARLEFLMEESVGKKDNTGDGEYLDFSSGLYLKTHAPVILKQFTVYSGLAENLKVFFNDFGNQNIDSVIVQLEIGKNVLDCSIPLSTSDQIAMYANSSVLNLLSMTNNFAFPYISSQGNVEITESLASPGYDFFFDLQFALPDGDQCNSERQKVTAVVNEPMSLNDLSAFDLTIFPNPSNGLVLLKTVDPNTSSWEAALYNGVGVLIKEKIDLSAGQIDLSDLAKGVYFLKYTNPEGTGLKKLILH